MRAERGTENPMGMDRSMWLKETENSCDDDDRERFIHDMDGDSPAVRLMLLVEKILYAPRILRKAHSVLEELDGDNEKSRKRIISIAAGMDMLTMRRLLQNCTHADLARWWVIYPGNTASAVCYRRLYGRPSEYGDGEYSGRMMSLMAFASRNEQWASRLFDILASYCAHAAAVDGIHTVDGDQGSAFGPAGSGRIPERCPQTVACMLCSAFNEKRGQGDDGRMVSPLSVTLSMIVSRCLDAGTALALPMVSGGLYGHGRDPMDDLGAVLGYAAEHPRKTPFYRGDWNDPGAFSILPRGFYIGEYSVSNVVRMDGNHADDAGMFALLTHPMFPAHTDKAVDDVGKTLSRICSLMCGNDDDGHYRSSGSVHFPLLAWPTFKRLADQPPRMLGFLRNPERLHAAMHRDHDSYARSGSYAFMPKTGECLLYADDEAKSQRMGTVMAERIEDADWSHRDVEEMADIVRAISPPPYDATGNPLDSLRPVLDDPEIGEWSVTDFLTSCMDADRMDLAADMISLESLMIGIDRKLGRSGSAPLDWDSHGKWRLAASGTAFIAMLRDVMNDDTDLPDEFIINDVLSRITCRPCRNDDKRNPKASRFEVMMSSERLDNGHTVQASEYELLIDWSA